jgi:hypothetical protein
LFVRKTNPIWYQGGSLHKYKFVDQVNDGHLSENNALIVATADDKILSRQPNHIIYSQGGVVRFKLFVTEKWE